MPDAGRLPPVLPGNVPVVNPSDPPVGGPVVGQNPPVVNPPPVGDILTNDPAPGVSGNQPPVGSAGLQPPNNTPIGSRTAAAPTGGAAQIAQVRTALASIPQPMKDQLLANLDNPAFVRFLLANPGVLERVGNLEPAAMRELAAAMPDTVRMNGQEVPNALKSQLSMGADLLGGTGIAGLAGSLLGGGNPGSLLQGMGVDPAALRGQMTTLATSLRQISGNPTAMAAINAGLDAGVQPGTLLRNLENASPEQAAALGRVASGRPAAGDVLVVLRMLRDATPDHNLSLNASSASTQALVTALGLPAGAFQSISFDANDRLRVRTGDAANLPPGFPHSLANTDLEINVSQLDGNGLRLSTQVGFGTALRALFTEKLVENGVLDVLLKILMAIFILPLMLYVALSSREVRADIGADGVAHVSVDHLFHRTNVANFPTGLRGGQAAPAAPAVPAPGAPAPGAPAPRNPRP